MKLSIDTIEDAADSRPVFRVDTGETGDSGSSSGMGGGKGYPAICSMKSPLSPIPAVGGLTGSRTTILGESRSIVVIGASRWVAGFDTGGVADLSLLSTDGHAEEFAWNVGVEEAEFTVTQPAFEVIGFHISLCPGLKGELGSRIIDLACLRC